VASTEAVPAATARDQWDPAPQTGAEPRTRGVGRIASNTLGACALGTIVLVLLAIVIAAAERPSFLSPFTRPGFFPRWMAGPLAGLWPSLTASDAHLRGLSSGAIALLFVSYLVALRFAPALRTRWLVATILAVVLILFCAPPLFSTDIFNYLNYGRMGVVHHLDPYTVIPALEPRDDPTFAISNWHQLLSPYGPLFTLITYALVPLGVAASFWTIKAIIALAFLGTLALTWRCAQLLGRSPRAAIVLVGLNPLVLVWGLGADHNDALMMLLVMLAVYLALRAREAPAGSAADRLAFAAAAALVGAVAIKASAAVLLPVFILAFGQWRAKLAGALTAGVLLAAISVLAFGAHLPGLGTQGRLVTPLGLPNVVGVLLGFGGETAGLHTVLSVILIATVLLATVVTARRPERGLSALFVCMLVLVLTLSWSGAWYVLWVLPFAALLPGRAAPACVLALTAFLLLAFAPNEPLVHRPLSLPLYSTSLGQAHTREINALLQ